MEVWAPVHAWRALGQLKAVEAVNDLLAMFKAMDNEDDWLHEELPSVMQLIGAHAFPNLSKFLQDNKNEEFAWITVAQSILAIGKVEEAASKECLRILFRQLKNYQKNEPSLNAFLISYLCDFNAVETMDLIREAFGCGMWRICGRKRLEKQLKKLIYSFQKLCIIHLSSLALI